MPSMHLIDAADLVVSEYGYADMAAALGKAESTLRHETNRNYHGAKLGLADAARITRKAQQRGQENALAILNAFAAEVGGVMVLPLPDVAHAGDCLIKAVSNFTREMSEYLAPVSELVGRGEVKENDLRHCQKELSEMIAAAQRLQALLAAKHLGAQPQHLREVAA